MNIPTELREATAQELLAIDAGVGSGVLANRYFRLGAVRDPDAQPQPPVQPPGCFVDAVNTLTGLVGSMFG